MPESCIRQLVTPENVCFELFKSRLDADEKLVDYICNKAAKLFLTLITIKELPQIEHFQALDITDESLDFDETQLSYNSGPIGIALKALEQALNSSELKDFCKVRWQFLAPILPSEQTSRKNFTDSVVIPLLQFEHKGDGGFSDVYRVKVHPAHWRGEVCEYAYPKIAILASTEALALYIGRR